MLRFGVVKSMSGAQAWIKSPPALRALSGGGGAAPARGGEIGRPVLVAKDPKPETFEKSLESLEELVKKPFAADAD